MESHAGKRVLLFRNLRVLRPVEYILHDHDLEKDHRVDSNNFNTFRVNGTNTEPTNGISTKCRDGNQTSRVLLLPTLNLEADVPLDDHEGCSNLSEPIGTNKPSKRLLTIWSQVWDRQFDIQLGVIWDSTLWIQGGASTNRS
ncbi:Hypothetical predicted protein [Xyrichtys novacula]|uniref:Uncharacterized protein n=1 Tax=Xyrichtys novacula TaxID=13765 RepID=A0AAV1H5M7_XYRNO|nr:Hypothetical predicted protein [Xyrichtys novacula]